MLHISRPRTFEISAAALERNFKELQRAVHPDLFGLSSAHERELSAAASSRANGAYQVLRSPALRAQYLLRLHGIDAIGESSGAAFTDTALLLEVMEVREALQEPATTTDAVRAHERHTRERCAQTAAELAASFAGAALERAAQLTVALQYYGKLLSEIEAWLEAHANAPR